MPDFEVTAWNAFYAPRDTPQPILDLLSSELAKALAQPETRKRLLELGFVEGAEVEVLHEGPLGGDPIAVRVNDSTIALRRREAMAILVI